MGALVFLCTALVSSSAAKMDDEGRMGFLRASPDAHSVHRVLSSSGGSSRFNASLDLLLSQVHSHR